MGEVYLAEDTKLDRKIALKVLPEDVATEPDRLSRFEREAKSVAALNHPNIVHVHSVEEDQGVHFFTMELVEGESLDEVVASDGLPLERFFDLAIPLADALFEAHGHGIVHRDLKPANIMVDRQGRPKILDFGLAKLIPADAVPIETEAPTEVMTEPGAVLGTYPYMSPEQAEGREATPRSDLFSFGIVLYEMATGERPFQGDSPGSLIGSILRDEPRPLFELRSDVPEALDSILYRCLEKAPEERYSSAAELKKELAELRLAIESGVTISAARGVRFPAFLSEEGAEAPPSAVFVGRDEELAFLDASLAKSIEGQGQVVFITGEAGTGKTALAEALIHRAQARVPDLVAATGGCSAHTGPSDPFAPVRQVLALLTGDVEPALRAGSLSRDQAQRLWELIPEAATSLVESASDLVETLVSGDGLLRRAEVAATPRARWLHSLQELVGRKLALPPDVMLQQSAVFGQCTRLLQEMASKSPLLLLLEDLHWADTGSVDLLSHLAGQLTGHRILILGTFRPSEVMARSSEDRHPLEAAVHEVERHFGDCRVHLGQEAPRAFVDELLDAEPNRLTDEFRERLFTRTGGHALFTVELLRHMRERGMLVEDEEGRWVEGSDLDWKALPAQVDGVIAERVGRLSSDLKELLRVASVEGERFTAEVLAKIREVDTRTTVRLLSEQLERRHRLVAADGLLRVDSNRLSLFRFLHALFQRYVYDGLSEAERAYLHEDVGKALEEFFGNRVNEIAAQLARHFEEAEIPEKAIRYQAIAGQKAVAMAANLEAIGHYRRALDLVASLPDSAERDEIELDLQVAINAPLTMTAGWAAPGVGEATSRALELAEKLGGNPKVLTARWFLSSYFAATGGMSEAVEHAERTVQIAGQLGDDLQVAMGHWMAGVYLGFGGRFKEGLEHLQKLESYCERERPAGLGHVYGIDPAVAAKVHLGWILACMGYPGQSHARYETGITLARELGHPHSLCFAIGGAAISDWILEDWDALRAHSAESLELALESGWIAIQIPGYGFQGLGIAQLGRTDEGIGLTKKAIALLEAGGSTLNLPMWLHCLALEYAFDGQPVKAQQTLDKGIRVAEATGELMFRDILTSSKGELYAQFGDADHAEQWLLRGIELARASEVKLIELKAATCLARMWHQQGREKEAQELLAPVYEWFSEGFTLPELREARALLEELE